MAALSGDKMGVSIHAPVKGATRKESHHDHAFGVSIHAPVKGATDPI